MKIALVSPYDFAYPGGVANHISCLARNLSARGHEVTVIAPASKAVPEFGNRFIPIGKPRPVPANGSVARITISVLLGPRISRVLQSEKFDLIHLHEPLMPMLCTTVLRLANAPTVGTFHASSGTPWYSFGTPVAKWFLKRWFRRLDGRIAVSQPAMRYVQRQFPGEYTIIPNGVDTKHFCPDCQPIDSLSDGKLNILFVGRLERRKGVSYLMEAYKTVKREVPNTRLVLVGPGARVRRRLEKKVARSGLKDVVMVGRVSYADLPRYYKSADVFCSPAVGRESFGIVLLEAMAVGKPIAATSIDGYRSVVTNGTEGLLAPPHNSKKLSEALLSLLTNEKLRQEMGARGRLRSQEFDWAHVTDRILDYYGQVLKGRRSQ